MRRNALEMSRVIQYRCILLQGLQFIFSNSLLINVPKNHVNLLGELFEVKKESIILISSGILEIPIKAVRNLSISCSSHVVSDKHNLFLSGGELSGVVVHIKVILG